MSICKRCSGTGLTGKNTNICYICNGTGFISFPSDYTRYFEYSRHFLLVETYIKTNMDCLTMSRRSFREYIKRKKALK